MFLKLRVDPYRLLFPVGYFFGLLGVVLWVCFYSGHLTVYPGALHAGVMIVGFQFCTAAGFLMTAVPRFTGTQSASSNELLIGGAFGILLLGEAVIAAFRPEFTPVFHGTGFLFSCFIALFFGRRFIKRSHSPPPTFSFVAVGLLFATFGNLILAWPALFSAEWTQFGRLILFHGLMLGLVLGVGSRLVTANLGWMQNPVFQISLQTRTRKPFEFLRTAYGVAWGWALLYVLSFVIESFVSVQGGRLLRAVVASFMIIPVWKIYRLPKSTVQMARWLWACAWFVILGVWIYALVPSWAVAGAHLMFIGGFSLMIFMIAGRVTLSHGGHDLEYESHSPVYTAVGSSVLFAAVLRFLVGVFPGATVSLTLAASGAFLIALAAWGYGFLPKILRLNR